MDNTCCVIEPLKATRKVNTIANFCIILYLNFIPIFQECYRVIKYIDKVYVLIKLSPLHPLDDVTLSFIGPEYLLKPIRETYEKNKKLSEGYDNEGFLRHICNLMNILYFPELHEGMPTEKDCAICLDYRDESTRAPFCFCENAKCQGVFHASCLQKYIEDKQHVVIFFNLVSGPCPMPYCGAYFKIDTTLFDNL